MRPLAVLVALVVLALAVPNAAAQGLPPVVSVVVPVDVPGEETRYVVLVTWRPTVWQTCVIFPPFWIPICAYTASTDIEDHYAMVWRESNGVPGLQTHEQGGVPADTFVCRAPYPVWPDVLRCRDAL